MIRLGAALAVAAAMAACVSPPSSAAPILIYTPGYAAPVFPDRSLLIELRPDLSDIDAKTFVTADVLGNLGPRIRRAPAGDARPATRPEASS